MPLPHKKLSKKALARLSKKAARAARTGDSALAALKLPEVDGWLTRDEASVLLKISPQTIKNYESRGTLHPQYALRKDRGGVDRVMLVYNPNELTKLPPRIGGGQPSVDARSPGEQAAKAFELFRQSIALDEVVIKLRETPERITHLHESWLDQTKARFVISAEAKKAFEELIGCEFKSVTELLEAITRKLSPA